MAKKTTTKKTATKATTKKSPAKETTTKKTAPKKADANLKAIAAADQQNATKRDQRAASADGMTPSERAMAEAETVEITIYRAAPGGAYHWRIGDDASPKRYMARSQATKAARKAYPNALIVHEPDPPKKGRKAAKSDEPATPAKAAKKPGSKTSPDSPGGVEMATVRNQAKGNAARPPSGLDLAAKVLADAGEPLNAKQIAERAIAAGWNTSGKTPHATLYAAMLREISKKGDASRFTKADRGLFEAGASAKPNTKKGA